MKYVLKRPITVGEKGQPVTELVFREEVVAGDLRGIKLGDMGQLFTDDVLKIAGRLSGQTDVVMNRLGLEDFARVVEIILPFLNPGQPTGSEPSQS